MIKGQGEPRPVLDPICRFGIVIGRGRGLAGLRPIDLSLCLLPVKKTSADELTRLASKERSTATRRMPTIHSKTRTCGVHRSLTFAVPHTFGLWCPRQ